MAGAQLQNTTKLDECRVRHYYRPDLECIVTGTVEWQTRSPARNATASALAGFTYILGASHVA
jgi:hypothetical protein